MIKLLGMPGKESQQLHARPSTVELFRQGGFDVNLFRNEPGIVLDYNLLPERDRDAWGTNGVDMPLESLCTFRDHDFLDRDTLDSMAGLERPGAFIFNSWVEAWGDRKLTPCSLDDPEARPYAFVHGKPAEGIRRENSIYPKDGFWWNSQLRITPPMAGGVHFLEYFAHAVAELDACRVTSGGLFLDTAHADEMQRFARAYRALPAEKFETVGGRTDPVAVRTLVRDGCRYLYLVNRDYYPISVTLKLAAAAKATDLATGKAVEAPTSWGRGTWPVRIEVIQPAERVAGQRLRGPDSGGSRPAIDHGRQGRLGGDPAAPGSGSKGPAGGRAGGGGHPEGAGRRTLGRVATVLGELRGPQGGFSALKGRAMTAQGNALGMWVASRGASPEGARKR